MGLTSTLYFIHSTNVLPLDGVSYVLVVGEDVFVGFLKPPLVV